MKDQYGRTIDYLRISLTDKCNLRCTYCMPREGIRTVPHSEILSVEEIIRAAEILCELGIKRIRLTGGEPLVRKGLTDLLTGLSGIDGGPELCMTTNGVMLKDRLPEFMASGLKDYNISLDTLDRACFMKLTGKDALDEVLSSIDEALKAGCRVKLNCVPIKGINDGELAALAGFAGEKKVPLRFIELMPIGEGCTLTGLTRAEVLEILKPEFGEASAWDPEKKDLSGSAPEKEGDRASAFSKEVKEDIPSGPAEYVTFKGHNVRVGFISPMSHSFCSSCNRIRLTAEGRLKLCLCYPDAVDIKGLLRSGLDAAEIKNRIEDGIKQKPAKHCFNDTGAGMSAMEHRNMNQIGG